jgi:hypothetical protein
MNNNFIKYLMVPKLEESKEIIWDLHEEIKHLGGTKYVSWHLHKVRLARYHQFNVDSGEAM